MIAPSDDVVLATVARLGRATVWELVQEFGLAMWRIEARLRALAARGVVVVEVGADGVRRWRLA